MRRLGNRGAAGELMDEAPTERACRSGARSSMLICRACCRSGLRPSTRILRLISHMVSRSAMAPRLRSTTARCAPPAATSSQDTTASWFARVAGIT